MRARLIGLLLLLAGCATTPPAPPAIAPQTAPQTAPAPAQPGDTAPLARPPADPRYIELLEQAQRAGAAITPERMVALRWAWVNSTDYDPIMPSRLVAAASARFPPDGSCTTAGAAADAVLAVHWLDLRAHATKLACAERERDQPAIALHGAIRRAILAAMRATGDGSGPGKPLTVIAIDEEYALLHLLRARRTAIRLVQQPGGVFDVMDAVRLDDGQRLTLWFRVDDLFAFYRRRPSAVPLQRG